MSICTTSFVACDGGSESRCQPDSNLPPASPASSAPAAPSPAKAQNFSEPGGAVSEAKPVTAGQSVGSIPEVVGLLVDCAVEGEGLVEVRFLRSLLARANRLWRAEIEKHRRRVVVVGAERRWSRDLKEAGEVSGSVQSLGVMLDGLDEGSGVEQMTRRVTVEVPQPNDLMVQCVMWEGAPALHKDPKATSIANVDTICNGLPHYRKARDVKLEIGYSSAFLLDVASPLVGAVSQFQAARSFAVLPVLGRRPAGQINPNASVVAQIIGSMPHLREVGLCGVSNAGTGRVALGGLLFGGCRHLVKLDVGATINNGAFLLVINNLPASLRELRMAILVDERVLREDNVRGAALVAPLVRVAPQLTLFVFEEETWLERGLCSRPGLLSQVVPLMTNLCTLGVHPAHVDDLLGAVEGMAHLRRLGLLGDWERGLAAPSLQTVVWAMGVMGDKVDGPLEGSMVDWSIWVAWEVDPWAPETLFLAAAKSHEMKAPLGDVQAWLKGEQAASVAQEGGSA